MSKKTVALYDTTLRDGNQALGISLSTKDKLRIGHRLAEQGFDYIEGGWPTPGNTTDIEFFRQAEKLPWADKLAVFGSTRRKKIEAEKDPILQQLVKCNVAAATIFGKSWDLHVEKVIQTTLEENLDMIAESVHFLKKHFDEVIYDAEHFFDGYKNNPEYALKSVAAAREAGADCIVLCDTNGGVMADEMAELFAPLVKKIGGPIGVHMHNDAGCAVANSIIAVTHGAVHVQGTLNSLGERCGNANLCTIAPCLQLKRGIQVMSDQQMKMLTETSIFVSEIANVRHDIRQPFVGEAAFSHKAGTHADGVRKSRHSFEHVDPESVGNKRRFVVSDQAGTATMLERLSNYMPDLNKGDERIKKVLRKVYEKESEGYQYEAAEASFELIAREQLGQFTAPFTVVGFSVTEQQRETGEHHSEATIMVEEREILEHTAALGDGPVNALDSALRKALGKFYPTLAEVKLSDFKVRVLDEKQGTAAKVRVLITSTDGLENWSTIGVSTNILQASWLALIDSLKYKLMKNTLRGK